MGILKDAGKTVSEISGVMPNPTIHKLYSNVDIVSGKRFGRAAESDIKEWLDGLN